MPEQEVTVTLSVSRKVNLGNYESADVFIAVSNVPVGASQEQIAAALVTGDLAFALVATQVYAEAARLKTAGN